MPIYIQYDSLQGNSASTNSNTGWIQINSFQFGASRSVSTPTRGGSGKEESTPSVGEIVVNKSPYSLTTVKIVNALFPPPRPSAGAQPTPNRPGAMTPVPLWLKNFLADLRPYMAPHGTIHISGFQFDATELAALTGAQIRPLAL